MLDAYTFLLDVADLATTNVADQITDYTAGTDPIRVTGVGEGDAVTVSGTTAIINFTTGAKAFLLNAAGVVVRLDFDNRKEYWDTGTNATWAHYTDYLKTRGQTTSQDIFNDNGTWQQRHIDVAQTQTWAEYTDYFASIGGNWVLSDQEIITDAGTRSQRHIDTSSGGTGQTWTE